MKVPSVYILARAPNSTLYVGVTSDLSRRIEQHDKGLVPGFTSRYGIKQLVYFEIHTDMASAIVREKRLKRWHRAWKVRLIEQMNPAWANLYDPATGAIRDGPGVASAAE
ncbi:MAG: GIY-YIG nuclease family protein [Pseudomonadota bacterium]